MKQIENIIYLILSGYLDIIPIEYKNKLKPKNLFLVFRHTLGSLRWNSIQLFKKENINLNYSNKIWVIYESKNNYNALEFLKKYNNVFINPRIDFKYKYQVYTQIKSLIQLFFYLIKRNKIDFYFNYFYRLGLYEESVRYLKIYRPKKIIFSNDHNPKQRALILAAKEIGIKTYYFQHGCVSKFFPPLHFSVAFLDGQASYEKYKSIGTNGCEIELAGMIRAKQLRINQNKNKKVSAIGLALNELDSFNVVIELINFIKHNFSSVKLIVRFHPAQTQLPEKLLNIIKSNSIIISDSSKISPINFLNEIDLLIAGNSTILLEAAIMNIVPVFIKMNDGELIDYYDFISKGLVVHCKNYCELKRLIHDETINKSTHHRKSAGYFDQSLIEEIDIIELLKKHELND